MRGDFGVKSIISFFTTFSTFTGCQTTLQGSDVHRSALEQSLDLASSEPLIRVIWKPEQLSRFKCLEQGKHLSRKPMNQVSKTFPTTMRKSRNRSWRLPPSVTRKESSISVSSSLAC